MSDGSLPKALWFVRHGESSGNVARDAAEAAGLPVIDIATRDMDVPLSDKGRTQAAALGRWLAAVPEPDRPTVVLTSPYVRAGETARLLLEAGRPVLGGLPVVVDERLREREFGILDRLTKAGIIERHPEEAERRAFLGKFFHRPPGGESWADVALRLRTVLDAIARDHDDDRILVVTHQVVITLFRYLLERLTEDEVLAVDRAEELANCSLSTFEQDDTSDLPGGLRLTAWNAVHPVVDEGAPVTTEPDVPAGPR